MAYRVAVDVGGTFTDIAVYSDGELRIHKTLTTPSRPVEGILRGLREAGVDLSRAKALINASTLGTNIFFGQEGLRRPRIVLITNSGFEDVIEIGRQNRPSLYDPFFRRPEPLVSRRDRFGVRGRIGWRGEVIEDLDVDAVSRIARGYCGEGDVVFVVSFLHSYANPIHEEQAREAILRECPGAMVVLGSEVDPSPMEYERTSTAVVSAVLKPMLEDYLRGLEARVRAEGFRGVILVMQSSGGVASVGEALRFPAAFIESGPAAGAIAASLVARLMGVDAAISFDMGGTTAKASSIIGGEPETVDYYEVGGSVHMGRLVRGSGYPVRYRFIDIAEVSAGGGTIAWIDKGGALRVGPRSAGSDPGPACYGRGGREPTVTDANLVLGRLPGELAGGSLRLSRRLAEEAIRGLAGRLGLDVHEAAEAIVRIANDSMSRAIRLVTIERGHDPRDFTLIAFGGAGPLHAVELARELEVPRVVIPPNPGVFSAFGLLASDYKHYYKSPIGLTAGEAGEDLLEEAFKRLEARAIETLESEGVDEKVVARLVEARYRGQGYTLTLGYPGSIRALVDEFHGIHEARYGFSSPEEEVEIVSVAVEAIGMQEKPRLAPPSGSGDPVVGEAEIFDSGGWVRGTVYSYESLRVGERVSGPGIVVYADSTLYLPRGSRAVMGGLGELVVEV